MDYGHGGEMDSERKHVGHILQNAAVGMHGLLKIGHICMFIYIYLCEDWRFY